MTCAFAILNAHNKNARDILFRRKYIVPRIENKKCVPLKIIMTCM